MTLVKSVILLVLTFPVKMLLPVMPLSCMNGVYQFLGKCQEWK